MPGIVSNRPVATRERLDANQECGFELSASRGIRGKRFRSLESFGCMNQIVVLEAVDSAPAVTQVI